jgi:hypothetical protein
LFTGISLATNAKKTDFPVIFPIDDISEADTADTINTMTLEVTINQKTTIKMEKVPTTGYLEVYSILGRKVTSINLKTCVANTCSIDLAKGIFILKAGKVAKKVIVK